MVDIWMWQETIYPAGGGVAADRDLTGYDVEATDGGIGKIDSASNEVGRGYLVVDTGWWIFGKRRLVPAGVVTAVDESERKVYVSCTKEQIKAAPDYDDTSNVEDDSYRDQVGGYYRPGQY